MHTGDLVTLPWWTQLWLNEGFAAYFEQMGAAFLYNDYTSEYQSASDVGGLQQHPGPLNYMHAFPIDVLDVALRCAAADSGALRLGTLRDGSIRDLFRLIFGCQIEKSPRRRAAVAFESPQQPCFMDIPLSPRNCPLGGLRQFLPIRSQDTFQPSGLPWGYKLVADQLLFGEGYPVQGTLCLLYTSASDDG